MLLLHGAGGSSAAWSAVAPALTADHRVLAADVRCWDTAVADVEEALAARGAEHAALVGHSLGGMLAVLYASEHPETRAVVDVDGFSAGNPELFRGLDPDLVRERVAQVRRDQVARGASQALLEAVDAIDVFELMPRVRCPLLVVLATEPDPSPPELPWLEELQEAHFRGILERLRQLDVRTELIPSSHGRILLEAALAAVVQTGIS